MNYDKNNILIKNKKAKIRKYDKKRQYYEL